MVLLFLATIVACEQPPAATSGTYDVRGSDSTTTCEVVPDAAVLPQEFDLEVDEDASTVSLLGATLPLDGLLFEGLVAEDVLDYSESGLNVRQIDRTAIRGEWTEPGLIDGLYTWERVCEPGDCPGDPKEFCQVETVFKATARE